MRTVAPELTVGGRTFRWGERTYVMGIINVTPDSFSGDGLAGDPGRAEARALRFRDEGADILDIGAESTRPGHTPISAEEELRRLIPCLRAVLKAVDLPVSVDTYKAEVARKALEEGAHMVNDVWGLRRDPDMARVVAEFGVPVVIMHNRERPEYSDLMAEVKADLMASVDLALRAGVPEGHIILDPGIGFGKTPEHNLQVLNRLDELRALGFPILVGTSRKSVIGYVLDLPVNERLEGTSATVALSIARGADIVRVHDVRQMVRVARMSDAVVRGWRPPGWRW